MAFKPGTQAAPFAAKGTGGATKPTFKSEAPMDRSDKGAPPAPPAKPAKGNPKGKKVRKAAAKAKMPPPAGMPPGY